MSKDAMTYATKEQVKEVRERKQVVVDKVLDRIYKRHGTVTTDLLIEEGLADDSPIHGYFDWDDSVAGPKWRKTQALAMIMASKFVVLLKEQENAPPTVLYGSKPEVRRLVNAFKGEGFKMRVDALSDDDERKALIERRLAILRSWCRSVVDIEELRGLREVIEAKL